MKSKEYRPYGQLVATLGSIGYMPAPGTWGSFCALLSWIVIHKLLGFYYMIDPIIIIVAATVAYYSISSMSRALRCKDEIVINNDPSEIIIDEFAGCLIALCGLSFNMQCIGAFLLFRFFDITKIMGISTFEKIKGPWGILLDDIAAGLYAALVLRIIVSFLK